MCQAGLVELSALTPVVTLLADAGYQGLSAQTGGVVLTPRPADIEETIKAGVLEQGTVDVMRATGVRNRMMRDGFVHHGINLAFAGAMHRIDMLGLTGGRAVTVYAQHEVLKDLIGQRLADDGDLRFGVSDTTVEGVTGDRPTIRFVQDGRAEELECDLVIGCDRSRTYTRFLIPEGEIRTDFFRQYPFAWFGIPAEAPHRPRRVTEEPPLGLPGTMFRSEPAGGARRPRARCAGPTAVPSGREDPAPPSAAEDRPRAPQRGSGDAGSRGLPGGDGPRHRRVGRLPSSTASAPGSGTRGSARISPSRSTMRRGRS